MAGIGFAPPAMPLPMIQTPTLSTARLTLRPLTLDDAPAIERGCSAFEVAKMTLRIPHPYPEGQARNYLAELLAKPPGADHTFGLVRRVEGDLIGMCGLHPEHLHDAAELGYWVGVPFWGQGFASETVREIVRFGFEDLQLNRIHAFHYTHNPASGRVLAKAGFVVEGVQRQRYFRFGERVDSVMTSILRFEWEAGRRDTRAGGAAR